MTLAEQRWAARHYDLHVLTVIFGTVDAVRALGAMEHKMAVTMRAWLSGVEALVRRALLFDALALLRARTKPEAAKHAPAARAPNGTRRAAEGDIAPRKISFRLAPAKPRRALGARARFATNDPAEPDERRRAPVFRELPDPWLTRNYRSFSVIPDPALARWRPLKPRLRTVPRGFADTRPLADRFAALARAIESPAPLVRRLAALFHKKGAGLARRMQAPLRGYAAKWCNARIEEDIGAHGRPDLSGLPDTG